MPQSTMVMVLAILVHSLMTRSPRRRACADILPNFGEAINFLEKADAGFWNQIGLSNDEASTDGSYRFFNDTMSFSPEIISEPILNTPFDSYVDFEQTKIVNIRRLGRQLQAKSPTIPTGAVVLSLQILIINNSAYREVIYFYNGLFNYVTLYLSKFLLAPQAYQKNINEFGANEETETNIPISNLRKRISPTESMSYFSVRDVFAFPDLETIIRCRPDLRPLVQRIANTTYSTLIN